MNQGLDATSGFLAVEPAGEQLVVAGLGVASMGNDGEANRCFVERLGGRRSTHTTRVAQTSMFGNTLIDVGRTRGE
jgi:hypothetical protein